MYSPLELHDADPNPYYETSIPLVRFRPIDAVWIDFCNIKPIPVFMDIGQMTDTSMVLLECSNLIACHAL